MNKTGLRLGLLVILIIASNLNCVSPPTAQSILPATSATKAPASEMTITSSLTVTTQPVNSATLQPEVPTITSQPTEVQFTPLPDFFSQSKPSPLEVVQEMLKEVNRDRALTDLRRITGEEPICTTKGCYTITNRETGGEGLQWAKDYVYETLVALGYSVEVQGWSRKEYTDQNLIARKQGKFNPDEEIYFIAHLDGYLPDNPAADDNASGAVDLLELARVLSSYSFSRTLVLFFSTGEEHGALGVRSYIDQLSPEELSSIKAVVNIDMVGYDEDRDGVMELWSGDHAPSLAFTHVMSDTIRAYQLNLVPRIVTGCD